MIEGLIWEMRNPLALYTLISNSCEVKMVPKCFITHPMISICDAIKQNESEVEKYDFFWHFP